MKRQLWGGRPDARPIAVSIIRCQPIMNSGRSTLIPLCTAALLLVAGMVVAGCNRAQKEPVVLANVGGSMVTPLEFQVAYAFGHGHLRRADDAKKAVLGYLLREKVLADEARMLRLDTLAWIRYNRKAMEQELLVERVFTEHAVNTVEVTTDEIRAQIQQAAVRFQFRFVPATDSSTAARAHAVYVQEGFDAAVTTATGQADLSVTAELTSPLVKATDIDPAMLALLSDLPVRTPSEPVELDGVWYILEVLDIRRTPLSDEDFSQQTPSIEKVIRNRRALEAASVLVASNMEPLNVTTTGSTLRELSRVLLQWYAETTPRRSLALDLQSGLAPPDVAEKLVAMGPEILVRTRDGSWTVHDFLEAYVPSSYPLRADTPPRFQARLMDVVALVVRDSKLTQIGRSEGLDNHAEDRDILRQWEDKWLFHALRDRVLQDESSWALVAEEAERLLAERTVSVNASMLDTLTLSTSNVNPYMTVHLMKGNSNRMPYPIPDPNWRPIHIGMP